jgi:hypothetical protein
MRLLTFVLNALWEEACRIENGNSFIEQRIKYPKYLLVWKCLKNEAPIYLKNKIQSDRNPYSLRNIVSVG